MDINSYLNKVGSIDLSKFISPEEVAAEEEEKKRQQAIQMQQQQLGISSNNNDNFFSKFAYAAGDELGMAAKNILGSLSAPDVPDILGATVNPISILGNKINNTIFDEPTQTATKNIIGSPLTYSQWKNVKNNYSKEEQNAVESSITENQVEGITNVLTAPVRFTAGSLGTLVASWAMEEAGMNGKFTPQTDAEKMLIGTDDVQRLTKQNDLYGSIARGVGVPAALAAGLILENPFVWGGGTAAKVATKDVSTKLLEKNATKIGFNEFINLIDEAVQSKVAKGDFTKEMAENVMKDFTNIKLTPVTEDSLAYTLGKSYNDAVDLYKSTPTEENLQKVIETRDLYHNNATKVSLLEDVNKSAQAYRDNPTTENIKIWNDAKVKYNDFLTKNNLPKDYNLLSSTERLNLPTPGQTSYTGNTGVGFTMKESVPDKNVSKLYDSYSKALDKYNANPTADNLSAVLSKRSVYKDYLVKSGQEIDKAKTVDNGMSVMDAFKPKEEEIVNPAVKADITTPSTVEKPTIPETKTGDIFQETITPKRARDIVAQMREQGYTEDIDLPQISKASLKAEDEKVAKIIQDPQRAFNIAMGYEKTDEVSPQRVYVAVSKMLNDSGDIEKMKMLAESPHSAGAEATRMGQAIKMLDDSEATMKNPTKLIGMVTDDLKDAAKNKYGNLDKAYEKEIKTITDNIDEVNKSSNWLKDFIDDIIC